MKKLNVRNLEDKLWRHTGHISHKIDNVYRIFVAVMVALAILVLAKGTVIKVSGAVVAWFANIWNDAKVNKKVVTLENGNYTVKVEYNAKYLSVSDDKTPNHVVWFKLSKSRDSFANMYFVRDTPQNAISAILGDTSGYEVKGGFIGETEVGDRVVNTYKYLIVDEWTVEAEIFFYIVEMKDIDFMLVAYAVGGRAWNEDIMPEDFAGEIYRKIEVRKK